MKKLFWFLYIFIFGIICCNAKERSDTFHSTFIGDYHYVYTDGSFGDFEYFKRDEDNKIAYCIEPGIPLDSNQYIGYQNLSNEELAKAVNISPEVLEELSLYSYFGYNYPGHQKASWFVAAQSLMWEKLGKEFNFTSKNYSPNPFLYVIDTPREIKKNQDFIKNMVNLYHSKPELDGQTYHIMLGETKTIVDLISDCKLEITNDEVFKNGSVLTITPTSVGKKTVTLRKDFNYGGDNEEFMVYHNPNGQDLMLNGILKPVKSSFSYIVDTGTIILNKQDKENKKELKDSIYELYKDETFVKDIIINGSTTIDGLSIGKYYLKEKKAPVGYELDNNKYNFEIKDNKPINITLEDNLIKANINIHKSYLYKNIKELPEENITFVIINKNNEDDIKTLKTDKNGNIKVTLEYGEYILRQSNTTKGYEKSKDIDISIKDNKDININLINKPILKNIIINKKDVDTKTNIKNIEFNFVLLDKDTNKEYKYSTNKDGIIYINNLPYGNYILKEIDNKDDLYEKNNNILNINIDDNSRTTYDYYNKRIKKDINIHKVDELNNPLDGVIFDIYAKNDIKVNEKTIYKKDELIDSIKTDINGDAKLSIYQDNYYIKEIKTKDGYILDDKIYDINLNNDIFLTLENYKIPNTSSNITLPTIWIKDEKKNYIYINNIYNN